jgi:hypothetical protein
VDIKGNKINSINAVIANTSIQSKNIFNPIINDQSAHYMPSQCHDVTKYSMTSTRLPDIRNPDIRDPDIRNPDIRNPDIRNPDIRGDGLTPLPRGYSSEEHPPFEKHPPTVDMRPFLRIFLDHSDIPNAI